MHDMNGGARIIRQHTKLVVWLVVLMAPENKGITEVDVILPAFLAYRQFGADYSCVVGRGPATQSDLQNDHCYRRCTQAA